jgi:Sulfotransferase family
MNEERGPIFIGGPDRCGKTLLAGLLASHSRISIPVVGSNLWPLFYRQHGDLRDPGNARRCLGAMLRYKHIAFLRPDPDAVMRAFLDGPRSYARLFALVQEQFAARHGKPRWGDQTGLVERYADEIFEAYPGVRFLHMVRDPRDRYAESRARWPEGRLGAGGATARWLFSVRLGHRNARRYGDRYRLVRYETLVTDPEGALREVCASIGEAYEPSMLELGAVPTYRAKLLASIDALPPGDRPARGTLISPAFIGGYREHVSPPEVAFIQSRAGAEMRSLGYELDSIRLAGTAAVRHRIVDGPLDALRMYGWWAREALAYRFPRWLGRRPNRPVAA